MRAIKPLGTDAGRILRECTRFLDGPSCYRAFSTHRDPHADGLDTWPVVAMLLQ